MRHFSHVCDLRVEGKAWRVIDVVEKVGDKGWAKDIVLLDDKNLIGQTISYETERPLFCNGNRLVVYGDLRPTEFTPPGNILVFRKIGPAPATERIDWPEIASGH